ncbi:uncharacterized protein LOC111676981 isoform X2 [Lucilia cuprina]|uniref:uncharacterized protein LOC111676981 isoform X1 n=1 Tax=Lucilia cuprina TaxID=7375 RepID=UPI001F063E55|nr:uncharacterized protein LOC111676981 isoform X1 [Lucilia cuprina]XP_046808872.1 uncharacterized protein LOC111676981 isoform X2 [Lucilia cuprina]
MYLDSNNAEDDIFEEVTTTDFSDQNKSCESVKRRTVVGPWKNVSEFNKVYDWLFGSEYSRESREKALSQIRVWNLRRSTLCPAAVLATSVIIEVQLKDIADNKFTNEELQTLYANAFTRFFNFMSSIMQSHNMRTMYQTAKELGLESFVVDLRHICAHGQVLPPLQVLRNTAEYCISWLHDYYWSAQRNTMCDTDAAHIRRKDKTQFDINISELFQIYDAALEGHLKGATNLKTLKRHLHGKRFNSLKEFYTENKLNSLQDAFDVIVQQLCVLVKRDLAIKDMSEIYVEAFLKMSYFFKLHETHTSDEDFISLINVTQSLFRMLAVYGFVEELFLSLIEITENSIADSSMRAGASYWAVQIAKGFHAFRQCKKMYKAELDANSTIKEAPHSNNDLTQISEGTRELLIYSGVDMKRTIIFGDHFRRPWVWVFERNFIEDRLEAVNEYTAPILKSLLPLIEPELNKTEINTFSTLIDCLFETNAEMEVNEKSTKDSNKIFTVSDLLQKLNNKDNDIEMEVDEENEIVTGDKIDDGAEVKYGIWTLMPDDETHDWKSCPLGRLPWE